jgi:PAS domain S-box-containing protein
MRRNSGMVYDAGRTRLYQGRACDINKYRTLFVMKQSSSQSPIVFIGESRTLENITDALVTINKDWCCTHINPTAEHLLGMPCAQILNHQIWDVFPEITDTQIETGLRRVMSQRQPFEFESYNNLHNKWYANKVIPGPNGNISIYFDDISERKRAEAATARLAAIVESSDDAIITKDLNGIITSWNRGAQQIFGYEPKEVIGQSVTVLMPPERLNEEPDILQRIRDGEKIDHYETVRRRKNGTLLNISLSVSPIADANGNIIGASKIARDITARKRSEERLHLLWEVAAIMLSTDNPGAMVQELFAKVSQHLSVDTCFNYIVNAAGDALQLMAYAGIPDATARSIEWLEFGEDICGSVALHRRPIVTTHIQQSDDPKIQLLKSFGIQAYTCNPLLVENRLMGTLSFGSRTKNQFDAEEVTFFETLCQYVTTSYERLQLVEQLREADRRKDEFLATLAHELRNPLAPVRNSLQLLRLANGDSKLIDQSCNILDRQVAQLIRLVDDLLDVARITRGRLDLRRETADLAAVIRNAVEISNPFIEQMGHKLTVTLPKKAVHLNVDAVRISQVYSNLLNNAAKYTESGGHIWLTAECQGSDAVVTVRDTGIGIPSHNLPHIFDEFMQLERSQERSQDGLGIGLTLVKRLTEMHGGSVEARSAGPDKGSEFTVRLPIAAISGAADQVDTEKATTFNRRRILIVDDNRDGADSLARILKLLGNRVQTAYNGIEAIQAAEGFLPDVVLLDIGLPKIDGHKVCRYIREQPWGQNMTLIAVTGWGQDEDKRRSLEVGFNFHLVKPIDPSELDKLLAELVAAEA